MLHVNRSCGYTTISVPQTGSDLRAVMLVTVVVLKLQLLNLVWQGKQQDSKCVNWGITPTIIIKLTLSF